MEPAPTESPVFDGPYLVAPAPRAMLRFALGSSCTIATLLCIPDGIGILPGSATYLIWCVRMVGLWCAAYILWSLGFLGVLFLMRLVGGGMEVHEHGLKLWRFGKIIPWDSIKAVSCEPQPLFRRMFFIPDPVYKLTLYREKADLTGKAALGAQHIPSFQLDPDEFRSLLVYICRRTFGSIPSSVYTTLAEPQVRPLLRHAFERGRVMRVIVSCFILFSLVSFLGRRAAVNYSFNLANKEFRQEHYKLAAENYFRATTLDPFFAPAWDRLARSEARLGKVDAAEEHWRTALKRKPDFVESKIGLSLIVMNRGEYTEAQKLLESAVRLSPTNTAAYMNLANLYLLRDEPERAEKLLQPMISKPGELNVRAHALLARVLLRQNRVAEAQRVMDACDTKHVRDLIAVDKAFFFKVQKAVRRAAFRQEHPDEPVDESTDEPATGEHSGSAEVSK